MLRTSICFLLFQKISARKAEECDYIHSAAGHGRNFGKLIDGLNPGFSDLQTLYSVNIFK